jgi:hypothetical protein
MQLDRKEWTWAIAPGTLQQFREVKEKFTNLKTLAFGPGPNARLLQRKSRTISANRFRSA